MFPEITVTKTTSPRQKPQPGQPLPFGHIFSDHMFVMDYVEGQGWINPRIVPYGRDRAFRYGIPLWSGCIRRS